mmetsp:Transcript_104507/g.302408  ORF Transcript_104507/g.302408 Transcript_104507/m.302408 type:complete len:206 (+) Transcript_104507:727-1344(+)
MPVEGGQVPARLQELRHEGVVPGRSRLHLGHAGGRRRRVMHRGPMRCAGRGLQQEQVLQPAAGRQRHDVLPEGQVLGQLHGDVHGRRLVVQGVGQSLSLRGRMCLGRSGVRQGQVVLQHRLQLPRQGRHVYRMRADRQKDDVGVPESAAASGLEGHVCRPQPHRVFRAGRCRGSAGGWHGPLLLHGDLARFKRGAVDEVGETEQC